MATTASTEATGWYRRNPWFHDPKHLALTSYALSVHERLIQAGYSGNSEEYFDGIDEAMREKFPDFFKVDIPAEIPALESCTTQELVNEIARRCANKL